MTPRRHNPLDGGITVPKSSASADAPQVVEPSPVLTKRDLGTWIQAWLSARLRLPAGHVDMQRSLADHGTDSLAAAELAKALSDKVGCPLDESLLWGCASLNEVAELVHTKAQSEGGDRLRPPVPTPLQVKVARTDGDRAAIYRLRYEVYVDEMRRPQPAADHENRKLVEPLDETATLIGCFRGDEALATCRVNFSETSEFENRELYDFDQFERVHSGRVAFLSKLMIHKEWRATPLFALLARAIHAVLLDRKMEVAILDCNDHLVSTFENLGFVSYKGRVDHPLYGSVTPMVLMVQDQQQARSLLPFFGEAFGDLAG